MTKNRQTKRKTGTVDLSTFYIAGALCGMDILKIQEVNKLMEMTRVPQAPDYVKGILNLRGQIITIIDFGIKLGLASIKKDDNSRNIIVKSGEEYIGFLVERIGDVVSADWEKVESPPANIGGMQGKYFEGVFTTENNLIGILDVDEVLKEEEN